MPLDCVREIFVATFLSGEGSDPAGGEGGAAAASTATLAELLAELAQATASAQSERGCSSSVGLRRVIGCFLVFCSKMNATVPHTAGTHSEIAW